MSRGRQDWSTCSPSRAAEWRCRRLTSWRWTQTLKSTRPRSSWLDVVPGPPWLPIYVHSVFHCCNNYTNCNSRAVPTLLKFHSKLIDFNRIGKIAAGFFQKKFEFRTVVWQHSGGWVEESIVGTPYLRIYVHAVSPLCMPTVTAGTSAIPVLKSAWILNPVPRTCRSLQHGFLRDMSPA